jgi:hypothetical protein
LAKEPRNDDRDRDNHGELESRATHCEV